MSSSAIGNLRALGLCGIDDSVDPELLALVSSSYPFVEWGVLFRPDLVGQPRYASPEWLQTLFQTKERSGKRFRCPCVCQTGVCAHVYRQLAQGRGLPTLVVDSSRCLLPLPRLRQGGEWPARLRARSTPHARLCAL